MKYLKLFEEIIVPSDMDIDSVIECLKEYSNMEYDDIM